MLADSDIENLIRINQIHKPRNYELSLPVITRNWSKEFWMTEKSSKLLFDGIDESLSKSNTEMSLDTNQKQNKDLGEYQNIKIPILLQLAHNRNRDIPPFKEPLKVPSKFLKTSILKDNKITETRKIERKSTEFRLSKGFWYDQKECISRNSKIDNNMT